MLKKTLVSWRWPCVAGHAGAGAGERDGAGADAGGRNGAPIGAAFLLGVAAAAGATAQGRATSAAAEGMSRNPGAAKDIRGMTLLGLVLIESLRLYALLNCFLIYGLDKLEDGTRTQSGVRGNACGQSLHFRSRAVPRSLPEATL